MIDRNNCMRNILSKFTGLSAAAKISIINIVVFVILRLLGAVSVVSGHEEWIDRVLKLSVEVPSDLLLLATRPWTLLTYMFSQYEVWHILLNMLLFYWFATIFLNIYSSKRVWWLYMGSGFMGALFFILFTNIFPGYSGDSTWLIGSSAAVLGIITATSILCPDYPMMLFLIGEVRLKWVGLITILLTLAGGLSSGNTGGNLAHAGGILAGAIYALYLKYGSRYIFRKGGYRVFRDASITPPFIPKSTSTLSAYSRSAASPKKDMEQLDIILDKIRISGYDSLSSDERKTLYEVSSRIK